MYNKIRSSVLLIECGFISNVYDRNNLIDNKYQETYTNNLTKYILEYFKANNKIS